MRCTKCENGRNNALRWTESQSFLSKRRGAISTIKCLIGNYQRSSAGCTGVNGALYMYTYYIDLRVAEPE